jgi:hypothetical protein
MRTKLEQKQESLMSSSPLTTKPDPFAHLPEASHFMILLPDEIADDDDKVQALAEHMEAAFPEAVFEIVHSRPLRSQEGQAVTVRDPAAIPLMGFAGPGADPDTFRRRPSAERMREIQGTLDAYLKGAPGLN